MVIQRDFKGDYSGKYDKDLKCDTDTIELFNRHMCERDEAESVFYPDDEFHFKGSTRYIYTSSTDLNSNNVISFIKEASPSLVFVFGVGLLKTRILNSLKDLRIINLHFGLTPYYRGSNTLLWPLYLQNPGHIGITLHEIDHKIDHGPIYHQQVTRFLKSDTIHEIFCKTIIQVVKPTLELMDLLINGVEIEPVRPKKTGKLFNNSEFTPNHLRIIYQLIDEGLISRYLEHKPQFSQLKLYSVLNSK